MFQFLGSRLSAEFAYKIESSHSGLFFLVYNHQSASIIVKNALHQLLLHHVKSAFSEWLVKCVKNDLNTVRTNAWMEVECIFRRSANPFSNLSEVCQT